MSLQSVLLAVLLLAPVSASSPTNAAPELVATYYHGDGLGANVYLQLHADGSFDFRWQGCLGTYDEKYGRWSLENDLVRLRVEREAPDGLPNSLPETLRPIQWDARLYLVDADDLQGFLNQVNDGSEPRTDAYGQVYLRDEDWLHAVVGPPRVPESARDFLLSRPIRGKVTSATGSRSARVNVGAQHGLLPGMLLHYQGDDGFVSYRVLSTAQATAEVETEYRGDTVVLGPVSTLLYDARMREAAPPDK